MLSSVSCRCRVSCLALAVLFGLNTLTTAAPVIVRYAVVGSQEETSGYQAIIDKFNAAQGNIRVEMEVNTGGWKGQREKVLTQILGNAGPDIVRLDESLFQEFAHQDLLLSLTPHIKRAGINMGLYFPGPLKLYQYKGEQYGFPLGVKVHNTFFNVDMFDRHGLSYPQKSWRWQHEYRTAARKMTQGTEATQTWGLGWGWTFKYLVDTIWSFSGEVFNADFSRCMLGMPQTMEALQTLADLQLNDGVQPSGNGRDRFVEGKVGMWINGVWSTPTINAQAKGFHYDIAHKPSGPAGLVGILRGSTYAILKSSENTTAAFEFIQFAMSEAGQRIASDNLVEGIPAMRSMVPYFLKLPILPPSAGIWAEAMEYGRPYVVPANMEKIEQAMDNGFSKLRKGELSARQLGDQLVPVVNGLLSENAN